MANRRDLPLRLLHQFDLNARQSFSALSRQLGPSREVVADMIRELEGDGTIRGYITVIDIGRLGYTAYAVYARLDSDDEGKLKKFFEYLHSRSEIYWTSPLGGRFDVLFAIQAKTVVQLSQKLSDIQKKFPFVSDTEFAIRTRATQFQRAYLVERPTTRAQGGFEPSEPLYQLSDKETHILEILVDNPRISVVEIAKRMKITRVTVKSLMKRLEKSGIIQGYSALISCSKLGYECYHVLITLRRFDQDTRDQIRKFASDEPSVIFCIETIGAWQEEFHCEVPSQREVQEVIRRFRRRFSKEVARVEVVPNFDYYLKYRLSV